MIKPKTLILGETIAFIAPSSGLSAIFPHRLEKAKEFLEKKGYKVKLYPTTSKIQAYTNAGTIQERVNDLHDAFLDKEVKAIVCSIGGLSANEIIKHIDYDIIKKNPKIFCGYSDISVLHYAINAKTKLVTFYGPCAMPEFGEYPETLGYTWEFFQKALTGEIGSIIPSKEWTDELLDWSTKEDIKRERRMVNNKGFSWLKEGRTEGEIIGGCLSSILQLVGTEYDLDYTNKIFFFEIPEGQDMAEGEPINFVRSQLFDLKNLGVFDKIKGLIVGRSFRYSDEDRTQFLELIKEVFNEYSFPILANFDIGHTDPMVTIPLGVGVKLDSENNLCEFYESGVV